MQWATGIASIGETCQGSPISYSQAEGQSYLSMAVSGTVILIQLAKTRFYPSPEPTIGPRNSLGTWNGINSTSKP